MDKRSLLYILDAIRAGVNIENRKCCDWGIQNDLQSVEARSFCLRSQYVSQAISRDCGQKIDIPEFYDQLIVFHRQNML